MKEIAFSINIEGIQPLVYCGKPPVSSDFFFQFFCLTPPRVSSCKFLLMKQFNGDFLLFSLDSPSNPLSHCLSSSPLLTSDKPEIATAQIWISSKLREIPELCARQWHLSVQQPLCRSTRHRTTLGLTFSQFRCVHLK